jgi:hypothetical protein
MSTLWEIIYTTKNGEQHVTKRYAGVEMDDEAAAVMITREALGEKYLLIDQHRDEPKKAVALLRFYGVAIDSFRKVDEQPDS